MLSYMDVSSDLMSLHVVLHEATLRSIMKLCVLLCTSVWWYYTMI